MTSSDTLWLPCETVDLQTFSQICPSSVKQHDLGSSPSNSMTLQLTVLASDFCSTPPDTKIYQAATCRVTQQNLGDAVGMALTHDTCAIHNSVKTPDLLEPKAQLSDLIQTAIMDLLTIYSDLHQALMFVHCTPCAHSA